MIDDSLIYKAYRVKFVASLTLPLFIMLLKLYILHSLIRQLISNVTVNNATQHALCFLFGARHASNLFISLFNCFSSRFYLLQHLYFRHRKLERQEANSFKRTLKWTLFTTTCFTC